MKGGFKMKSIKNILPYLLYFIVGNLLFNLVFSIIKTLTVNIIGGNESYINTFISSFNETILIYIPLFLLIVTVNILYKTIIINQLNSKLKKVKERGEKNEQ